MINENIKVTGDVCIKVFDEAGNVKDERVIKNLVVSVGKTFIASRMVGVAANVMSHMAIGSSSTSPAAADTGLGGELGRVALGSSSASGAVATYTASFPAGTGTGAVVEAGIFNAASAGTMLCRTTFAVVNKGANDGMSVTWTITVS